MAYKKFSFGKTLATSLVTIALGYHWAWPIGDLIGKFKHSNETQIPRIELKNLIPVDNNYSFIIEDYFSPNFTKAKNRKIDLIVLHTNEGSEIGGLRELTDPKLDNTKDAVSAHYFIQKNGRIKRLVDEKDIAWHCKAINPKTGKPYNVNSIGIEFSGYHNQDLSEAQIEKGAELIRRILDKYHLNKQSIKAHSELDPKRRKDPGKKDLEKILR